MHKQFALMIVTALALTISSGAMGQDGPPDHAASNGKERAGEKRKQVQKQEGESRETKEKGKQSKRQENSQSWWKFWD